MNQKVIDLHNDYRKGFFNRREFLKKLSTLTGGAIAALFIIDRLDNDNAYSQIVQKNDPRLHTEYLHYPGETGDVRAYHARLKGEEKLPGVIVIHENRGLNPHIEDVARRIALEGFYTIAPDALSPLGGTPEDSNEARTKLRELDRDDTEKDFVAAVKYLKTNPMTTGKVGVTGFCWGGRMTNQVAVNAPELDAAVPYYGSQPAVVDVPKIKAAMLIHYGEHDERINRGIPDFEAALKEASIEYSIHIYKGAHHAFNNDTSSRYHKEAAELAWERTVTFFKEKLKT